MSILDICKHDGDREICTSFVFTALGKSLGLQPGHVYDTAIRVRNTHIELAFCAPIQLTPQALKNWAKKSFKLGVARGLLAAYQQTKPDDKAIIVRFFAPVVEEIGEVSLDLKRARKVDWTNTDDKKVAKLLTEQWKL